MLIPVRVIALFLAILFTSGTVTFAQQSPAATDQRKLTVEERVEKLESVIYEFRVQALAIIGALTGIAGLAALGQWFSSAKARERERVVTQMLELMKLGEELSQKRTGELHNVMFEEGQQTLRLVNDTLELAKAASESAVSAAKKRVKKKAAELETSISIFLRPYVNRDNREIVNNMEQRDKLRKLIDTLSEFEYINNALEFPEDLLPNCQFLKALAYYMEKQFDATIETLQSLVERNNVSTDMRIRSLYWIAYELNNIGKFREAENSFTSAIAIAEESKAPIERILELERLRIETKLFNRSRYKAVVLIDNIDEVINKCGTLDDVELQENLCLTKSNILYAAAMDEYNGGQGDKELAREFLRQAKAVMQPLAEQHKSFAEREYGLICLVLQENVEDALALLYDKVRGEARQQVANRLGARHKAYFSAIQLMILKARDAKDPRIPAIDVNITRYVGEVHDRVTIYSPLRKRNVERAEFMADVRSIVNDGLPQII